MSFDKEQAADYHYPEGSFMVGDLVGEGRFARVYHANVIISGESIAFRQLKFSEAAIVSRRHLIKEVKMLMSLRHRNIVQTFGVVLSKKAFVQEYCMKILNDCGAEVQVHTLLGLISVLEDDVPINVKFLAVHGISAALMYLHSIDTLAGDLKPANVLVSGRNNEWEFKLSDISDNRKKQHLMSSSYSVNTQDLIYTAAFVAPELINDNLFIQNLKSPASDMYALSILMYQLLFPTEPFLMDMHPLQVFKAVQANWRPIVPLNMGLLNEDLVEIMKSCWKAIPDERPTAATVNCNLLAMMHANKISVSTKGNLSTQKCHLLLRMCLCIFLY